MRAPSSRALPCKKRRTPARVLVLAGLLLLCESVAGPDASRAQSGEQEKPPYTMAFIDVPLPVALRKIMDRTQLSLAYDPEMVAGRTAFCKAEEAGSEELLACVLKNTGLDYVQLSSGTYTLRPDVRSQPLYGELSGRVVDESTGQPLGGANVLLKGTGKGRVANTDGRFSFPRVKPGPYSVVVTYVGYRNQVDTVRVQPNGKRHVALTLAPQTVRSQPIVVNGFEIQAPSGGLATSIRTADQLTSLPQVGTPDVVRGLASVAGVRLGDALSDVHLQGGAAGEQQFHLDGVPVFMPVSSGGLISPFSPFALDQVTVRKAGFGAEHGSALSGIIELDQRAAPLEENRLMARVDPTSANVQWGGRFGESEDVSGSWMLTGRRDLWDVYQPGPLQSLFADWSRPDRFLLNALRPQGKPASSPSGADGSSSSSIGSSSSIEVGFADLHGAAQVAFGDLSSLHLSFYRSVNTFGTTSVVGPGGSLLFDELDEEEAELEGQDLEDAGEPPEDGSEEEANSVFKEAYRWRNRTGQLRYEWVRSGRLFLSARAWGSDYRLNRPVSLSQTTAPVDSTAEDKEISVESEEFNEIREIGARLQADLAARRGHDLSGAVEIIRTHSDVALSTDPFGASPVSARQIRPTRWRASSFLEDRISLGEHAGLTLGTRLTYLPETKTLHGEPRVSLRYDYTSDGGQRWATRLAAGLYRQYVHSFDVTTYNITALFPRVRYWLPIGEEQRPPEAYHAAASVLYRPTDTWSLRTETYYKHQPHLLVLDYAEEGSRSASSLFQEADGHAYGAAATVTRTGEHLEVTAQYEYAVSRRRVPGRFGGTVQPTSWNAPHRAHLSLDLTLPANWTLTARWQGVWGRRWGFRQAYYDFLAPDLQTRRFPPYDLSNPAAHRLPATSRLDLGIAYTREVGSLRLKGRATLVNALDRDNVTGWGLRYVPSREQHARDPRRASPLTPSVSLRVIY